MAKRFALSSVDPFAITLCKQGANRQRFFLRKSTDADTSIAPLPGSRRLLKQADGEDGWSVVYCVVAEPDAPEDPGMVGEAGTEDVWASADEIRKAAHRLLKNKAYVNLMHDALAEEGCAVVENAVALADFEIEAPDGSTSTIRKGSWYVAIEPNDEAREKIESGEIESISIEGTGVRTLLEKDAAMVPNKPGVSNWVEKHGGLPKKIADLAGDLVSEKGMTTDHAIAVAVSQAKKNAAKGKPEWVKAVAEWEALKAKAHAAGDLKKSATFAELMGGRELTDQLWRASSTLQDSIWDALRDENETDPKATIRQSVSEFEAWLLSVLEGFDASDGTALAKALATLDVSTATEEDNVGLAEDFATLKKTTEEKLGVLDDVKKNSDATTAAVTGLVDLTGKLVERVEALSGAAKPKDDDDDEKKPSLKKAIEKLGDLADRQDEADEMLTSIAKSLKALAKGESAQDDDTEPVRKSKKDDAQAFAEALLA